jgi:transcriptional regulator with PAS, ATPase and Fis domain
MDAASLSHLKRQFGIVGDAPALNRAIEIGKMVAPTDLSVLISGESGTGKESFSKLIHALSPYKHGKFIAINCGAIPEGTIDSELFGHEKGAFTGASEGRKGYFEEANGGTVFLDEIGEMPLATQTKLLRILEYGEFIKVGSSQIQKTKVRVVAATNLDLQQAIYNGTFREDLYYRLNTVPLLIPPLRERGNDIMLLFIKFATEFADRYYIKPLELTLEAQALLLNYRFPGNIRQLKNLTEQLSVLEASSVIDEKTLRHYLPAYERPLPTLYRKNTTQVPRDIELLYKLFFDLKKDMQDLKSFVFDFLTNQSKNKGIAKALPATSNNAYQPLGINTGYPTSSADNEPPPTTTNPPMHNLPSLEEKEREMIVQALEKFNNNRKKTAQSLGISERTLYRKINQYELEA